MSAIRDRLGVPETPEERAWTIWCQRGVIVPGFADEIAQRRRLQRHWTAANHVDTDDGEWTPARGRDPADDG